MNWPLLICSFVSGFAAGVGLALLALDNVRDMRASKE